MPIEQINCDSLLSGLLNEMPGRIEKIRQKRDSFLTDAVLLGEIPSPTFGEENRVRTVVDRFRENGLDNPLVDEFGNASAQLPGNTGESSILIMAHADTVFSPDVRHEIQVGSDAMTGPGIADNALGLAAMISLPRLLKELGIQLKYNPILVALKSLGRANMEGARGFLETMSVPTKVAFTEGSTLGRLSYLVLVLYEVKSPYKYRAIMIGKGSEQWQLGHLTGLINQIREIPILKEPETQIVFGGLKCGSSYNTSARYIKVRNYQRR